MTHMIRQHYLHVELHGTESDGLALQRSLPVFCQDWLLPAIERVLDGCAPPAGQLCIERLELDLGAMPLDRLQRDLPASLARELERTLREHVPPAGAPPPASISASSGAQLKAPQQCIEEAFLHFLATGNFPWSFRLPEGVTLEQAVLDSWRQAADSGAVALAVKDALLRLLRSANVRQRLVRQFTPIFLQALLSEVWPQASLIAEAALRSLPAVESPLERKKLVRQFWETLLAKVATGGQLSAEQLLAEVIAALPASTAGAITAVGRGQAAALQAHMPDKAGGQVENESWQSASEGGSDRVEAVAEVVGQRSKQSYGYPPKGEGIYIDDAGLVLLHPFLPGLFQALGISEGDDLLQPERALCLLHYLATGRLGAPEHELMLPKILCNVPLQEPVDAEAALTAGERKEAEALLRAVIGHWQVLRNTSPDALRGTFLLRPGKISRRDGEWLLQVESQSCDLLLDQLTWSISMIKLPWMEHMLWVEWR